MCKICGRRRAKRYCPAVQGDICALCCGTERETTLLCPLQCEWLQQAHRHERPVELTAPPPNLDIEVSESFVRQNEEFVLFAIFALLQASLRASGAVDGDVLDALEALIQSARTLQSGLVYESISPNAVAASIQRGFSSSLGEYQKLREEREALQPVRDSDVLKTLVFLQRLGLQNRNGKPRGRMFLDILSHMTPEAPPEPRASALIV